MRESSILFSATMVRAILGGSKTQTRRVVKPCKDRDTGCMLAPHEIAGEVNAGRYSNCPYGHAGDRLWVRETHALQTCAEGEAPPFDDGRPINWRPTSALEESAPLWTQPHYRATDPAPDLCCEKPGCAQCRDHDMGPHWRPSIYMPRWASRITLEITGVRVQRLHDITANDIKAEGIRIPVDADSGNVLIDVSTPNGPSAFLTRDQIGNADAILRAHWAALWCAINGRASWDSNPWVWVVQFARI